MPLTCPQQVDSVIDNVTVLGVKEAEIVQKLTDWCINTEVTV